AVIATNSEGCVTRMNPVAEQLTGWPLQEAKGLSVKSIFRIIDASTREPIENPIEKVLSTGETVYLSNHTTLIARDATEYHIADSAAPIRNGGEEIQGMVLIFNDVTEQYRLRQAVRNSQRDLQAIMDNSPTAIYVCDLQGCFTFINQAFETLLESHREDIIGKTLHEVFLKPVADQMQSEDRTVMDAEHVVESEGITFRDDGRSYVTTKFPMFDDCHRVYAVCSLSVDVTERKHQEEQLRRSQKMDALGKLTGGIAHDYNNMLGVILGYSELLHDRLDHEPQLKEYAQIIQRSAERGATLTQKLLTFTRFKSQASNVQDINELYKASN
ncbi:MAG: PAS domain-containing protein, partial [Pseudomonadales bacterium]|nr:PAS domain-containing protein [Pseudomonadales bacterium]